MSEKDSTTGRAKVIRKKNNSRMRITVMMTQARKSGSKTDQRGKGMVKAIPFVDGPLCAGTALRVWLTAAEIDSGPVFRAFLRNGKPKPERLSDHAIAIIIKEAAARCGLDSTEFSGHSLRAGHVTEARSRGVADASTMSTTGHKRVETLDMYDRRENAFQKTSAGDVLRRK